MIKNFKCTCSIFATCLVLGCTIGCSSPKDEFEDYYVTESGILRWNEIVDAKYYRVHFQNEDYWTEDENFDLSGKVTEDSINGIYVKAFIDKTSSGEIMINPLQERIVRSGGKFYFYDNAPKYTVTINNSITTSTIPESKAYTDLITTNYVDFLSGIDTTVNNKTCYKVEGLYTDSNYKNAFIKDIVLSGDITLYAKIKEMTTTIIFNYQKGEGYLRERTVFDERTYKCTSTFSLSKISLPSVDGYGFGYWNGYEGVGNSSLPTIKAIDADGIYTAIYFKNVDIYFINKPFYSALGSSSSTPEDYIEYGKLSNQYYKGEISEDTIQSFFGQSFKTYYWCYKNNYNWSSSYSELKGISNKTTSRSIQYEEKDGNKIYIWGENE